MNLRSIRRCGLKSVTDRLYTLYRADVKWINQSSNQTPNQWELLDEFAHFKIYSRNIALLVSDVFGYFLNQICLPRNACQS